MFFSQKIDHDNTYIYQKPQRTSFIEKSLLNRSFMVAVALVAVTGIGITVVQLGQNQNIVSRASGQQVALVLSPVKSSVMLGENFTISVISQGQVPLSTAQLHFSYPSNYMEVLSITPGTVLPTAVSPGSAEGGTGFIALEKSPQSAPQTTGTLTTITFRALRSTATPLEIRIDEDKTKISSEQRVQTIQASPALVTISTTQN